MSIDLDLVGGAYLLRALGFTGGEFPGDLADIQAQPNLFSQLQDSFANCAGHMGNGNDLASLLQQGGIPPSMFMPPPNMANCPCANQYAMPQMPFGLGLPAQLNFKDLFGSKRQAKKFEKALKKDPFLRAQVEMMLGGMIILDKKNDGKIKVQPFVGGGFAPGMDPQAMMALAALAQVQRGGMSTGLPGMSNNQMFLGMMLGALALMHQNQMNGGGQGGGVHRRPGGGSPFVDWNDDQQARRARSGGMGGRGGGGGGVNGPHQGRFGIGPGGGDEVSAVLADPSLTVEDKVTLMIMLIMKKMDKDIEKQANYINSLQQQQNGGQGGFPGGATGPGGGGGGDGSSPSIDVETMKLKRLIDKRSQMFDMLRQIIDKYNQTAKGIIDSMGR
jgi:hypothetical protein